MTRFMSIVVFVFTFSLASAALAQPEKKDEVPAAKVKTNPDPHNVYSTGLFQEVYIDEDFKLYRVRTYQGMVPGRDSEYDAGAATVDPPRGKKTRVKRLGFEQRELFSRVFVLADRPISPWIYDNFVQAHANPDVPYQIFVEISTADIPKFNDRRPLITRSFNTPIRTIQGTLMKEGVRVVITLKREARYLPVQVGKVLYIDVER
mgnify:CR=1 FL=1